MCKFMKCFVKTLLLTKYAEKEDKRSDYYREIRAATSYRNHILELIDNIDGMITSLDHCPDL